MRTYDNIRKIATDQGYEIQVNNKHLMLIQKQYKKLILLEILINQKVQQCFSLLEKQKKLLKYYYNDSI